MTQSHLLEPLVDAIETVKRRIQEHGPSLRENETRTRIALIDPILQALGWDVSDPSTVTLEYDVSGRRADYALIQSDSKPAATIEAKKLGENLQPHRMQMLNYANASGVDYAGLTDGDHWELYDVFKRGELSERQLLDISIATMPAHGVALKLLLLWRPNISTGQPAEAESRVTGVPSTTPVVPSPSPQPEPTGDWIPILEFAPEPNTKPPSIIRFPDNTVRNIPNWKSIVIEVVEWLYAADILKQNEAPFQYGRGSIIGARPLTAGGKPLHNAYKIAGQNLYVETHGSAQTCISRVKAILSRFNVDLDRVYLGTAED